MTFFRPSLGQQEKAGEHEDVLWGGGGGCTTETVGGHSRSGAGRPPVREWGGKGGVVNLLPLCRVLCWLAACGASRGCPEAKATSFWGHIKPRPTKRSFTAVSSSVCWTNQMAKPPPSPEREEEEAGAPRIVGHQVPSTERSFLCLSRSDCIRRTNQHAIIAAIGSRPVRRATQQQTFRLDRRKGPKYSSAPF